MIYYTRKQSQFFFKFSSKNKKKVSCLFIHYYIHGVALHLGLHLVSTVHGVHAYQFVFGNIPTGWFNNEYSQSS